jgi:large subunit ribosomal protein L10
MSVTREHKEEIIDSVADRLREAPAIYLTDFAGLSVEQTNELRGRFRDSDVDYTVLKNTLLRIAMEEVGGYDGVMEYLSGPTAVAFTDDPAAPAKVIEDFTEEQGTEKPAFKAAVVEGDLYETDEFDALASLKSREELIGDILTLLQSPLTNVVGAVQSQGSNVASLVQALAEREE